MAAGDFATFVSHLEGLVSIYSLGSQAVAADKSRAWNALTFVERDIDKAYSSQVAAPSLSPVDLIHSTPLGMVEPRRGGLPMRIRYFLPPHHLIDKKANKLMESR